MLAEEFVVVDLQAEPWQEAQPLLAAVMQLEQGDEDVVWHGWKREPIEACLRDLPEHCTLLAGVWEESEDGSERLILGFICEVMRGKLRSVRSFEALSNLPDLATLEPGFEHARELLRETKQQVAPVAWAIFTDKQTWEEWILAEAPDGDAVDKGKVLAALAAQGRCVLLGSRAQHI